MGISVNGNNSYSAYNNWLTNVANGRTQESHKFSTPFETNPQEYNAKLNDLADGWMKTYDTDGDGKVTIQEYYSKELADLQKEGITLNTNEEKENFKKQVIYSFSKLDIDDEGDSEDTITVSEAKNLFYTMDQLDSLGETGSIDAKPNGAISPQEAAFMSDGLASEDMSAKNTVFGMLLYNYDKFRNQ